jgi:hypothetical protein
MILSCSRGTSVTSPEIITETDISNNEIVVYKSPSCGCCSAYVPQLENEGFHVEVIGLKDLAVVYRVFNIPEEMRSCHTAVMVQYFAEGHIPFEAVLELLEENPAIDGIALPGMPSGAPGMPGEKKGPFHIFAIKDGEVSDFMVI